MKRRSPGGLKEMNWRLFSLLALVVLLVGGSGSALAQVTASISGRVEDPSGAAIPAAAVTVTSLETGTARTVTTDESGNFRVLSLPVGRYEVKAENAGFKAVVQTGINLVVGQQAVVNLKLEVGTVQEQVTVTAEAPMVNTTAASVAGLVGEKQVKDLPLNGRSFDNLITLNAGTVNYTTNRQSGAGGGEGNYFSVSGRRPLENLYLLNGVEYTGASQVGVNPGGVSGQLLGIDAVREFNVVSGTYSAEYGKRAGGQVSVVTQSGTNRLHGSLFEFLRNSKLDARNFFDQGTVPPFKRNQFGGSAGGPIRKDKTFIFGSYEGFRQRLGLSDVTFVPDLNARKGLLPNAQGVPTPVAGLVPAMLPFMAYWPEPNGPVLGNGIAIAFSNPKQIIREDFGTARLDHTFSGKDSFSGSYTVDDGYSLTPGTDPVFGLILALRSQVLSMQELHIFSPSVINTFIAGFSRAGYSNNGPPLVSLPSSLSFVAGRPPGGLTIGGTASATTPSAITNGGPGNTPLYLMARSLFTYQDGVQVIKGKHQISFGAWFQQLRSNEAGASGAWGRAAFSNLQSFLQGTVATFQFASNSTPLGWRTKEGAWYLQDNIQVRPNLTLQLGLRHEFTNGWNGVNGRAANFLFDSNGVYITQPRTGSSVLTENNAKWLFSPRVGLAWDPFGKGKTSIRAGFGTHYNLQDALSLVTSSLPPFNGTVALQNVPLFSILPIVPGIPVPPTCGPGVPAPCTTYNPRGLQSSMKTPVVQGWNFTVEQQLSPNTSLRVAYVGSRGIHQLLLADYNAIHSQICSSPTGCTSGGTGAARGTVPQGAEYIPVASRPNPYLSYALFWFSEGNSSYNALQADLTRRLSRGLQFRGNYTWSKNLDNASGVSGSQSRNEPQNLLNPYNPGRDWGPSAMNATQQASGNFNYELPIGKGQRWLNGVTGAADKLASGWQLNGIVTLVSGFPFTPLIGSNRSGDGDGWNPDRPSMNPAFTGKVIVGSPNQWFNPNAFILPTPGTYGNEGKGAFTGPGLAGLDLSLFKSTSISERLGLQFRAEFFNTLNHSNFSYPNQVVFSGTAVSSSAGVITATSTTSRQIQFGLKFIF